MLKKLSFEEDLTSLTDIYNHGENINLDILVNKLNQEFQETINL